MDDVRNQLRNDNLFTVNYFNPTGFSIGNGLKIAWHSTTDYHILISKMEIMAVNQKPSTLGSDGAPGAFFEVYENSTISSSGSDMTVYHKDRVTDVTRDSFSDWLATGTYTTTATQLEYGMFPTGEACSPVLVISNYVCLDNVWYSLKVTSRSGKQQYQSFRCEFYMLTSDQVDQCRPTWNQ